MTTNATYKSFSNIVVNAEIGLHVGLYGINVTLKGESLLLLLLHADLLCNTLTYWEFLCFEQLRSLIKTSGQRSDKIFLHILS